MTHPAQPTEPTQPHEPTQPTEPGVPWGQMVLTVTTTVGVFLVGGALGAVIWAGVADPPTYPGNLPTFAGQPVPDGPGLSRTFNIDATFFLTAGAVAVVLGALCGIVFRANGIVTVVSVLVGSAVAYITMRQLGNNLGPETLTAQARGVGAGATLFEPLRVKATGVYFAWPVGALAGVIAALWALAPAPRLRPEPRRSKGSTHGPRVG